MPATSPQPGAELIGRTLRETYRVDRLVATGGMSRIYQAEHLGLHRKVAIKVMLAELSSVAEVVARFRREVEIVAGLEHPHIVQVLDVGSLDGLPFLVLEYLNGETLAGRLAREIALPVVDAVSLTSQVATALTEMHAQGVVHRDLKPANLFLVRATGEPLFVKVLDFGVSRGPRREERRLTVASSLLGTPSYMAPEQIAGSSHNPRVDQFALAAITYEALTGVTAFDGPTLSSILKSVAEDEPAPPSCVAPWVPPALDGVVMRGLSKRPEHRFESVSALATQLEHAFRTAGILTGRAPPRPSYLPERSLDVPEATQPTERVRPPSTPPTSSRPAAASSRLGAAANATATALFARAQELQHTGDLDGAVEVAERLLELAAYERQATTLRVVGRAMPTLDRIFRERVGGPHQVLAPGAGIDRVRALHLSPRAAALLTIVDAQTSVAEVIQRSRISERDGMRLLAGLLRRGALERVRQAGAREPRDALLR